MVSPPALLLAVPPVLMEHNLPPHLFPHDHGAHAQRESPADRSPSARIMLEDLLRRYWQPLVAYAAEVLGARDDAEDVAQEAFVRLWMRADAMHAQDSAVAFLYRVTRNRALNERRRRLVRFRWRERQRAEESKLARDANLPELHELQRAITRALAQLPARRREVFLLVRQHGLTHRQVAEALGISSQTVANHMVCALEQLRVLLAPFLEEPSRPERTATVTSLLERVAGQPVS